MAMFKSIATFALKNVVEGTVIAMGGDFAAAVCEQVGGKVGAHFRDHSRVVLGALQKAGEQALDTVEAALAGTGLLDGLAAGDATGLRKTLESLLEGHRIDGKSLDRAWRKACLAEWKAARRSGLFATTADASALEASLDPFARFRNQADLLAAEGAALRDLESAARAASFPAVAKLLAIRPAGGSNLFALAAQHHFQCAIPKDHALFASLTFAQLNGISAGQREALTALASLRGAIDEQRPLLDEALQKLGLIERHLRLGDGLSIRSDGERRLVKLFRDRLRDLPPEMLDAADLEKLGRLFHGTGDYEAAAPLLAAAADGATERREKARSLHSAFMNAVERRRFVEATALYCEALALDPTLAPFDPEKRPVEKLLGAGGFGIVVLCGKRHLATHRSVFKILRTEGLDRDPEKFMAEARLLEAIDHPNVVRILDADLDPRSNPPVPYLELEYFDGEDLDAYVKQHGALAPEHAIAIAIQIARGLAVAHEKKIWHRDVKPSNVLVKRVASGFEVKLIDFGLAARQDEMANSLSVSQSNHGTSVIADSLVGTLGYAAPEQLGRLKGVSVGPYSDVYGLGRTLCFLLFKKTEPLPKDWRTLPKGLAEIIENCLEENPSSRFNGGSARMVLAALEALNAPPQPIAKERSASGPAASSAPKPPPTVVPTPQASSRSAPAQPVAKPDARDERALPKPAGRASRLVALIVAIASIVIGAKLFRGSNPPEPAPDQANASEFSPVQVPLRKDKGESTDYETLANRSFEGLKPLGKNPNSGLYEYWVPASGVEPERRTDGHFRIEDDSAIVMVLLPGGSFWMGAQKTDPKQPNCDPGAEDYESPVHRVTLDPYFFAKYPLTQGQWKKLTGSNPAVNSDQPSGRERALAYPIERVSWEDCSQTLAKFGLVLPTEAQWEYGCRAGTSTPWWCGDENSLKNVAAIEGTSGGHTAIVDSLAANPFGLFQVHGNVWEWCQDWYQPYGSAQPRAGDGLCPGSGSSRVLRGGSYLYPATDARSARRNFGGPSVRHVNMGCRPARVAP